MIDFIKTLITIFPLSLVISFFNSYKNWESNEVSFNNPVKLIKAITYKTYITLFLSLIEGTIIAFCAIIFLSWFNFKPSENVFVWILERSVKLTIIMTILIFIITSVLIYIFGPKTKNLPSINLDNKKYYIIGNDGKFLFLIKSNDKYSSNNQKDNQFSKTNTIFLIPVQNIKNNITYCKIDNPSDLKPFVKNFKDEKLKLKFLKDNNQRLKNKKRKYKLFGYDISIKKSN